MKIRADPNDSEYSSLLYTQLLFSDGIGDWFYARTLNGVMDHNFQYGDNSARLTSCLWSAGIFVLKASLVHVKNRGKEFFNTLPKTFKIGMQRAFDNHVKPVWRSTEVLLYTIEDWGPTKAAHQIIMLLWHIDQSDEDHNELRDMSDFQ